MSPYIDVDGVFKAFGEAEDRLTVIEDLSFGVEEGEFVTLIGPSGCGKTTILRMIDGTVAPTAGEIRIAGEPVSDPRGDVAMVFQEFELFPWRTVVGNVTLGLEIRGVPRAERRARAMEWIETVGLAGFEDAYPSELSGGMAQRVGLARALVVDPDVLLLDEPFGALDAQTRDRLQVELLRLLEDRPKTVVFVTHDIGEAVFLSDRVFVLSPKPAGIVSAYEIDIDRPRWSRRMDVEEGARFDELRRALRREFGLDVGVPGDAGTPREEGPRDEAGTPGREEPPREP